MGSQSQINATFYSLRSYKFSPTGMFSNNELVAENINEPEKHEIIQSGSFNLFY